MKTAIKHAVSSVLHYSTPAPPLISSPLTVSHRSTLNMAFRSQRFSGRTLSAASGRSLGPVGFSSFGSQSVMGGGLQSGAGLGFRSGAGLGFGSGAGLGFGSGFGSGYAGGGGSVGASFRAGGGFLAEAVSNVVNEKQQMQVLNDRLATYLEKVKRLETTNHELNEKLRSFTVNRVQSSFNLEPYEIQIKPLREKLLLLMQDHTRIALAVDNAKLAADDFRMNRAAQVRDGAGHASVCGGRHRRSEDPEEEYDSTNTVLLQEVTGLEKECTALKEAHQQDMIALRGEMMGTVTVDVKEIESTDLSRVLAEIRSEYEMAIEKNRREAENWYTKQVEKKQAEVELITETTVSGSSEITDNRKLSLSLHTQLDAALMEKGNLEQRLVEAQARYQAQVFSLAQLAGSLEGELTSVRESALQQSRDYQLLLSTKVQLEREISTYKALLEGAGELHNIATLKTPAMKVEVEKSALLSSATAGAGGGVEVVAPSEAQSGGPGASETAVGGASAYALMSLEGVAADAVTSSGSPAAEI
ncbi:hypothetical protein G5714_000054 [Onychostoma macrolepis]|uniref:IF rod domain-containing protein n=1 Tax=Onychostoma macrolepis TaxID=369639 RepID=A0A7J6DF92_9TELE|nr:hypothetical protein G5714_000054 [Onychostoma macrolepis]